MKIPPKREEKLSEKLVPDDDFPVLYAFLQEACFVSDIPFPYNVSKTKSCKKMVEV